MKLGALALVSVLLGGCLLGSEEQVLDDLPPLRNRPPRILGETAKVNGNATLTGTAYQDPSCPSIIFEVQVEDPDIDDRIRYFWFADYDPVGGLINRRPFETGTLQNSGSVRRGEVRLEIQPDDVPNPLFDKDQHVVQLVVTDGVLEITDPPGTIPAPDPVEGVDGGNPRYSTSHVWVVETKELCQ